MKDTFFGRKQILELLQKRVSDLALGYRQNIAIIGDELVGKSTLIFRFLSRFNHPRTLLCYMEIRPETLHSFARRYIGILLYTLLTSQRAAAREELDSLLADSAARAPRTVEKARAILSAVEKRKKLSVFSELLSLCDLIHQETGMFCVMILDEFQNLEKMNIPHLYQEWSKMLLVQKTTLYIVISSQKHRAKSILSKDLSLLFGNFEVVSVDPFDIKTSEEYLRERLVHPVPAPGMINFIVHFTGGVPFYLDLIAGSLIKAPLKKLGDTLEELLFEPSGILNQRFSNFLQRFQDTKCSEEYTSLLYQISCGHHRIKDIAHLLHKPLKELLPRINDLLEYSCISKTGDFLILNDRVFGFWLKFVYQEKLQSLTFDAKNQKALFRNNIETMIQEYLLQAQKPILERMTELLHLFDDDVIQIEKKKLKLDHFREIKTLSFGARTLREGILGRSSDSIWIMAFKKEQVTEEDISDFTKECKKYRNKPQTKIIVTAREVDTNAKLRAMEEKIHTWDLNNLNRIFDVFCKPRIIA